MQLLLKMEREREREREREKERDRGLREGSEGKGRQEESCKKIKQPVIEEDREVKEDEATSLTEIH